jgi:hypothetical protein
MNDLLKKLGLASLLAFAAFGMTACDDNNVEDAADEMGDAVEDAADEVSDAAEDVVDGVKDATN